MKKSLIISSTLLFSAFSSVSMAASDQITFMLNGKPVKSIAVDKLGQLTFNIKTTKSFKQIFANQWGTLDSSIIVVVQPFKKGSPVPSLERSYKLTELENTYGDKGWVNKNTSSKDMFSIAKSTELYNADTSENIAFGVRYSRKEYTGKTIWKDGGWVQETRWVDLGPVLAKTVLNLEAPGSAKSINWNNLLQNAANSMNTTKQDPSTYNNSSALAKDILKGTSYESKDYDGSKVLSIEKAGDPVYSWNYDGDTQYVMAKIPAQVNIHAVKKGEFIGGVEADFKCGPNATVSAKKINDQSNFDNAELSINQGFAESCMTADGKKASEMANTNTNAKPNAENLINSFMKNMK